MIIRSTSPLLRNLIAAAFAGVLATSAMAQTKMTSDQHKAAESHIKADYASAKAACDPMKDNQKDVCEKEAQGKRDVAMAELDNQYKPSRSNARKVSEKKAEADYEVAKEKCDDQSGDAKDACKKQADANYASAKAAIKK